VGFPGAVPPPPLMFPPCGRVGAAPPGSLTCVRLASWVITLRLLAAAPNRNSSG